MTLKEDYDFTAQHLHTYKKVCRVNRLLIWAEHWDNAGGAVTVRNKTTEKRNIKRLRLKWPGVFGNSGRGGGGVEVGMRWDLRDTSIGGTRDFVPDPRDSGKSFDKSKYSSYAWEKAQEEAEVSACVCARVCA